MKEGTGDKTKSIKRLRTLTLDPEGRTSVDDTHKRATTMKEGRDKRNSTMKVTESRLQLGADGGLLLRLF